MSGIFGHGDFRLYLLKLLDAEPRHGYELIRLLEDETIGLYTPSAGSVYPRLGALEEEGLIEHDEIEGKKVYRLTEAGRDELRAQRHKLDAVGERIRTTAGLAREIRSEVSASVAELRREMREATREARDEARRARQEAREEARRERERARSRRHEMRGIRVEIKTDTGEDVVREIKRLTEDLETFASDIVAVARQFGVTRERIVRVRAVLRDARDAAIVAVSDETKRDEAAEVE